MTKYRIVSKNKIPGGETSSCPIYYAQKKFLGLFWVDCCSFSFTEFDYDAYDSDIECVRDYIKKKMTNSDRLKQEIVEVYDSVEDIP